MAISYSKLFVGISLPALCTGLASLLLSISADAQTIRPTTQKEVKVFDPIPGNSGNIGIRAAAGTLSYTLTLPAAAPSANQVLTANAVTGGNVTLTWATPVSGTVTSVGTNTSTGITGGTITNAGTLAIDTFRIATRAWRQKGIDSVQSNLTSGLALKVNISDTASMLTPYLRKIDTTAMLSPYLRANVAAATYVPQSRTITINGTSQGLTADRTFSVGTVTSVATNIGTGITGGTFTNTGTIAADTLLLSTRAWRQKGIDSVAALANTKVSTVAATAPISSTGGISPTISISQASVSSNGFLSSTDWTTFNNKQNTISLTVNGASGAATLSGTTLNIPQYQAALTNPVTGTGTLNYLSKFATAGTLTNSLLFDDGTNVGIGTITPTARLEIRGTGTTSATTALEVDNSLGNPLLVVKNDGSVGIGTTSPSSSLHVKNSAADFRTLALESSSTGLGTRAGILFKTRTDSPAKTAIFTEQTATTFNQNAIIFAIRNALDWNEVSATDERMRIDVAGNVGIGTLTPTARLEIRGAGTTSTTTALEVDNNSGNPLLVVRNDGNVGIGTTNPTSMNDGLNSAINSNFQLPGSGSMRPDPDGTHLAVRSSNKEAVLNLHGSQESDNGKISGVYFSRIGGASDAHINVASIQARLAGSGNQGGGHLWFFTKNAGNWAPANSPRMVLTDRGNVGIGTTSPVTRLDIAGSYGSDTSVLNFRNLTDGTQVFQNIIWQAEDAGGLLRTYGSVGVKASSAANDGTRGGEMAFATMNSAGTNTPRMTITSTGNVGIGTTNPTAISVGLNSAINSDYSLSGTMRPDPLGTHLAVRSSNNEAVLNLLGTQTSDDGKISGVYFSRIGGQEDAHINVASIQARLTSAGTLGGGQLWFFTKPANTWAPANSPQMVLNALGRLGIGVTSPGHRLDVSGDINITGSYRVNGIPQSGTSKWTSGTGDNIYKSSGNVGIGTTNPMFRLVVEGAQEVGAPYNGNKFATLGLIATNNAVGAGGSIEFGLRSSTTFAAIKGLGVHGDANTIGDLAFYTRAQIADASMTERMRITSAGKVSVGDTDPIGRFEVKAGSDDVEVLEIEDENESPLFRVLKSGVVRIPKLGSSSNTAVRINTDGTLTTSTSDARLKKNIQVIPNALQKVMGLRGVTYNWKDGRDTTRILGMIAQEMLKVAPELVFQNNNGYYGIHYAETTGLLVEAIKEQQKIIEELKKTQALMAGQLRQLQADLIKKEDRGVSTAPNQ